MSGPDPHRQGPHGPSPDPDPDPASDPASDPARPVGPGAVDDPPLWRRDFPLTSEGEEQITRREFTRYLLAASAAFGATTIGAAAWATWQSAPSGEPAPIVALRDLPEGGSHLFDYPGPDDPALLVHLPGGELRAFSQKCTHLGCVVFWQEERDRIYCPCHEGVFEPRTGEPVSGPPTRALERIDVEVRDGTVWATGMGS